MTIEKALLDVGKETYGKVILELYKRYQSYLPDCYEHPEYLSEILKELYGKAHHAIIKSINEQLGEFSYHKPIARFLEVINK